MVPAPAFLPAPVRAVLQWFVFDLILPEDGFVQAPRKISTSMLSATIPMSMLSTVFPLYQLATGAPPVGPEFILCCAAIVSVNLVASYVCVRRWGHISDVHMTTFLAFIVGPALVICHTWLSPVRVAYLALAIFVALGRPSLQPVFYTAMLVDALVSIYNDAAPAMTTTLLMFPGDHGDFQIARWALSLVYLGGAVLAVLGVLAQAAEHTRQLQARETAQQMLNKVVALLQAYDTEGVSRALEDSESQLVDPGLLSSLRRMNDKLLQYRPHLPNHMFEDCEKQNQFGGAVGSDVRSVLQRSRISDSSSQGTPKPLADSGSAREDFDPTERRMVTLTALLVDSATLDALPDHFGVRAVDAFPAPESNGEGLRFVVNQTVSMEELPGKGPAGLVYQLLREDVTESSRTAEAERLCTQAMRLVLQGDFGAALLATEAAVSSDAAGNMPKDPALEALRVHCSFQALQHSSPATVLTQVSNTLLQPRSTFVDVHTAVADDERGNPLSKMPSL